MTIIPPNFGDVYKRQVLNKSALIYIAAKHMGFEPDGMSQEQMKEMSVAFNLPK